MKLRTPSPGFKQLISALFIATLALPVHADSWPQAEVGAEAAGFTTEGVERLDAPCAKLSPIRT